MSKIAAVSIANFVALTIVAALLFGAARIGSQESKPSPVEQTGTGTKAKDEQRSRQDVMPPFERLRAAPAAKETDKHKQEQECPPTVSHDRSNYIIAVATCLLAIAALAQIWFLRGTMRATQLSAAAAQQNAIAAKEAADVARQQAELFFGNERAWLRVDPDTPEWWKKLTQGKPVMRQDFDVRYKITNAGRTPAFLNQMSVSAKIMDLPLPDKRPDYFTAEPFPPFPIPAGWVHGGEIRPVIVDQETFAALVAGQKCIAFYGFVKYQDAVRNQPHMTRFCGYWHIKNGRLPGFEPVGPADWVEYT